MREKIEKSREQRILNSKVSGNTLGEAREEQELLSAADWVKRSRKREKEVISDKDKAKLLLELQLKRMGEEEEEDEEDSNTNRNTNNSRNNGNNSSTRNSYNYSAAHLKGLQVMHNAKDFDIGQEVILTLADSSILDKDEDGHVLGE